MLYFDTSFLAPLVLAEGTSETVSNFFGSLSKTDRAISLWTQVELSSLVAIKFRTGQADIAEARKANAKFEAIVKESLRILSPAAQDFDRARQWLDSLETSLKSGDALHLAIAANRGAETIYTLDKGMVAAGRKLDLPVSAGPVPGYE